MDKVIEIPERVADVSGLLFDLQRANFSVRNVGSSPSKTYVYLDQAEEKDPTPIVQEWVGRDVPTPKQMTARVEKFRAEMEVIRAKKEAEEKAAAAAEAAAIAAAEAEAAAEASKPDEEEKPSLIKRIFRKLW